MVTGYTKPTQMKRPEMAFIPTPQTIRGTALQARPRQQRWRWWWWMMTTK